MPEDREGIIQGRKAVDAYREAHGQLHSHGWYEGISEDHTPLLEKLVGALEKQGFSLTETDFESRKTEILAKFWAESNLHNIKELGFANKEDFRARATSLDKENLKRMWH